MALFNKNEPQQATSSPSSAGRPVPAAAPNPMLLNMVGPGAVFEGVLRAKSDAIINGKVIGKIFVEGRLVINADGVVEGEVNSSTADIAGKVIGDVNCDERLTLKNTAMVDGNINTPKFSMEDGAAFTGKCNMRGALDRVELDSKPTPSLDKPSGAERFATQSGSSLSGRAN